MRRHEAIGFIAETHDLLKLAAGAIGDLDDATQLALLNLEETAISFLKTAKADFFIITDEGTGPGEDNNKADFFRLEQVNEIKQVEKTKIIEWPDGKLEKLAYTTYEAYSKPYTTADGRNTQDYTVSGPEGFIRTADGPKPFGAASALVARLLEAKAEGAIP